MNEQQIFHQMNSYKLKRVCVIIINAIAIIWCIILVAATPKIVSYELSKETLHQHSSEEYKEIWVIIIIILLLFLLLIINFPFHFHFFSLHSSSAQKKEEFLILMIISVVGLIFHCYLLFGAWREVDITERLVMDIFRLINLQQEQTNDPVIDPPPS